jgi:hypothetical protein
LVPALLPGEAQREVRESAYFWYIMEALCHLQIVGHLIEHANEPESRAVLQLIQKKSSLMVSLGHVAVVDFFIGNGDRFWLQDGKWLLGNVGNFFIVTNQQVTDGRYSGIDFFDPNSRYRSFFESIETQYAANDPWFGDYLHDSRGKDRDQIAAGVVAGFNRKLQGKGVTLGQAHQKDFRKGLHEGRDNLKKYLKDTKKKGGPMMPLGLTSRMQRLGW